MRRSLRTHLPLAAALAVLALAQPALAQKSTLPQALTKVSIEPQIIAGQLRMAIGEEKRALAGYEAARPSDSLTEYHQAASNAYVLIRAARSGMGQIGARKKVRDPVLDLVRSKVTQAWNRSRAPVDHINWGGPKDKYLEASRRQLAETIGMLEQILAMWP